MQVPRTPTRSIAWLVLTDPQFLLPFGVLVLGLGLLVALR